MTIHLYNAAKYFSKIMPILIVLSFKGNGKKYKQHDVAFILYCIFNIIATIYCSIWDYYMDWGLFRSKKPENYFLRD